MRFPEIHVYGRGPVADRVIWKAQDGSGREIDMTGWKVTKVARIIEMGEVPIVAISLFGRLVEHGTEDR